jgi:hypothetical protein
MSYLPSQNQNWSIKQSQWNPNIQPLKSKFWPIPSQYHIRVWITYSNKTRIAAQSNRNEIQTFNLLSLISGPYPHTTRFKYESPTLTNKNCSIKQSQWNPNIQPFKFNFWPIPSHYHIQVSITYPHKQELQDKAIAIIPNIQTFKFKFWPIPSQYQIQVWDTYPHKTGIEA